MKMAGSGMASSGCSSASALSSSARSGARISDFALLEFLGEGSTAHVYLAQRQSDGARVAIKMVDKLLVRRAGMEGKVRQERQLHAQLRHRSVLRVLDAFEDARNYYLVLELCDKGSLAALVRRQPDRKLPEAVAKRLFRAAVEGVAYLHESGVIHRDLKLANLLLTQTGELKISDFGLATRLGDANRTICGTPNFIAPEVLQAGKDNGNEDVDALSYTEAVDLWSLGCILHCLLLGRAPFEGRKVSETLENVANAGSDSLSFPAGFSASAGDLIRRLLTPDATRRPSAQQVLLHPWLKSRSPKGTTTKNTRKPSRTLSASKGPAVSSDGESANIPARYVDQLHHLSSSKLQRAKAVDTDTTDNDADTILYGRARLKLRQKAKEDRAREEYSVSSVSLVDNDDIDSVPDDVDSSSDISAFSATIFAAESSSIGDESDCNENDASQDNDTSEVSESSRTDKPVDHQAEASVPTSPPISVVLRFDVCDIPCLEIPPDKRESVEFACHEPVDGKGTLVFVLSVSNGWSARYELATGSLSLTSPAGVTVKYAVPINPNSYTSQSPQSRENNPSLVRFCQRLAMRALDLRGSAFRSFGASKDSKSPLMVHYDELPSVILDGVRTRSPENVECEIRDALRGSADSKKTLARRCATIRGVGTGFINDDGELCVEFIDGARLTLAASGRQLRFLPAPLVLVSDDGDPSGPEEDRREDVFDLLTAGHSSAFLPTIVTRKLACVPDFIQRIKASM